MMFGDKPASNWAMRFSGFISFMVAEVANSFESESPAVRKSFALLRWAEKHAGGVSKVELVHSFVTCFIDDFGM